MNELDRETALVLDALSPARWPSRQLVVLRMARRPIGSSDCGPVRNLTWPTWSVITA